MGDHSPTYPLSDLERSQPSRQIISTPIIMSMTLIFGGIALLTRCFLAKGFSLEIPPGSPPSLVVRNLNIPRVLQSASLPSFAIITSDEFHHTLYHYPSLHDHVN